jgi:ribosome biogenesis GTPase A
MSEEFRSALEEEFSNEDPLEQSILEAFTQERESPSEPEPPRVYQLYDPDEVIAALDRLVESGAFDVSEYGDADTFPERFQKGAGGGVRAKDTAQCEDAVTESDGNEWQLDEENIANETAPDSTKGAEPGEPQSMLQIPCPGCGANIQSSDPSAAGYLPARALEPKKHAGEKPAPQRVCQRCFQLTHYAKITDTGRTLMSPEQFRQVLAPVAQRRAVIVCMLDILDLSSSMLKEVSQLASAKSPILVALNKVDLLPSSVKLGHVTQWLWKQCAASGMRRRPSAVHLISAEKGLGIRGLMEDLVQVAREACTDHVYVMGAANVGKSTLLNRFLRGPPAKGIKPTRELTTSVVPGTTLGMLRLPLKNAATGERMVVVDTPGIVEARRVNLLCLNDITEMKGILPKRRLHGVTYRLECGKSIWLGGLVNIALVEGKPWFFTAYVSERVTVHLSDASRAMDEAYRTQSASRGLLWPDGLRMPLATVDPVHMHIENGTWKRTSADVVIPGLGWVALLGSGSCSIQVRVAGGGTVWRREPLVPSSIRDLDVEKYFGAPRQQVKNAKSTS